MGKAGLIGLVVVAAGLALMAGANAGPNPPAPPVPTPGAPSVTVRGGNMGNIGTASAGVNLILPPGAFWTGGFNGNAPVTVTQSATVTWTDANGKGQTSYFTLS